MADDMNKNVDSEIDITKPTNSPEMVSVANDLTKGIKEMRRIVSNLPQGSLRMRTEGVLRRTIRIADHWDRICNKYESIVDTPECLKDIQDFQRKHKAYSQEWFSLMPLIDRHLSRR